MTTCDFRLVEYKDPRTTQAIRGTFKNVAERPNEEEFLTCCFCYAAVVVERGGDASKWIKTPSGPPTTAWTKAARASKPHVENKTRATFVLARLQAKLDKNPSDAPTIDLVKAYQAIAGSSDLRKGNDWVTQLCSVVSLHYGCPSCRKVPLRNSDWLRLLRVNSNEDATGHTTSGESSGYWFCGVCLSKWSHAACAGFRTVIFHEDSVARPSDRYAFLGQVTSTQDNTLNFLKQCVLLDTLEKAGMQTTKSNILHCIETLSRANEQKLRWLLPEVKQFRCADPAKDHYAYQFRMYCEDPRLSLAKVGQPFHAADLSGLDVTALASSEVDLLIDVCAAALNFEQRTGLTKSERAIQWALDTNPRVHQARGMMLSRI
jgi:hypothetical protein